MCRAHLLDRVKRVIRGFNTDLAVITSSLTSVLQPLDESLNHPFKCRACDQWTRWISSGAAELTAAGNFKRPSLSTVATWIKTAWDSLEDCMIQKSFKKRSISNSLNGTENDILWTDVHDGSHDTDEEDEDDTYYDLLIQGGRKVPGHSIFNILMLLNMIVLIF